MTQTDDSRFPLALDGDRGSIEAARAFAGIRPRREATREELRTVDELHRQALAVRVEKALVMLSSIATADLAKLAETVGLDLMQHSQETRQQAEDTLNPAYLRKFRAFSDRVLAQGAHDILEIQALAKENVVDIIVDSPDFRELPPERRSLIQRLFGG